MRYKTYPSFQASLPMASVTEIVYGAAVVIAEEPVQSKPWDRRFQRLSCIPDPGELNPPLPEVEQHVEWNTRLGPGTSSAQNPLIRRATREHGMSSIAYSRQVQDLSSEGQWLEVSRQYTQSHFSTMQAAVQNAAVRNAPWQCAIM